MKLRIPFKRRPQWIVEARSNNGFLVDFYGPFYNRDNAQVYAATLSPVSFPSVIGYVRPLKQP